MHTAEEVRKQLIDVSIRGKAREMLLAYADLLEAMQWMLRNESGEALTAIQHLRQRAAEKGELYTSLPH